jgi:hypothetical protein
MNAHMVHFTFPCYVLKNVKEPQGHIITQLSTVSKRDDDDSAERHS